MITIEITNSTIRKMKTNESLIQKDEQYGTGTHALASVCHNCGICAYANRKPESYFGKIMAWHRNWCPARIAHNKVYGLKGDV